MHLQVCRESRPWPLHPFSLAVAFSWTKIYERMVNNVWEGVSIYYQKEESEGGKLLFGIVVLLEIFLDAQTTHLLPSMLYFKLVSSFFFCFCFCFFSVTFGMPQLLCSWPFVCLCSLHKNPWSLPLMGQVRWDKLSSYSTILKKTILRLECWISILRQHRSCTLSVPQSHLIVRWAPFFPLEKKRTSIHLLTHGYGHKEQFPTLPSPPPFQQSTIVKNHATKKTCMEIIQPREDHGRKSGI